MMWAKMTKKQKVWTTAVFLIIVFFSSTAIGLLLNYNPQPLAKEENIDQLLIEAKEKYYQGNYKESIEQYQEIFASSNSLKAKENLAAIYQGLGQYQLAIKHYQDLVDAKDDVEYNLSLAKGYYNTEQIKNAKKIFKKIVKKKEVSDYYYKEAYYYLALIVKDEANYDLAKQYLKQALSYRSWALGHYQLGEIAFQEKNYQQAITEYTEALSIDGSLKGVAKKLGFAYLKVDKVKQAAKYLQQAKRETAEDKLVNSKIAELKADYPQYFKKDPDQPLTREDIPEQVDFKEIKPLTNEGQKLRIGIMTKQKQLFFRVGSDFEIIEDNKVVVEGTKGELAIVTITDDQAKLEIEGQEFQFSDAVRIKPKSYAPVLLHQVEYGSGYYWGGRMDMQYRGQLKIKVKDNNLTAINIVPLEAYLMSVVPSEMIASWPIEALKVQSVAARSYTLANLDKHKSDSYDLCATVHCAAYRGINREHPRSNQAVQETAGEIMTYDSKPINAVYSANSGGHTENSEDVWNFKVPYLRGVSTQMKHSPFPLSPAELKEWLQEIPESYSQDNKYTKASHYRWQRELKLEYLESRLDIKEIEQIIPTNRGIGGSVESVLVVGKNKEKKIKSGLRYKFGGLRSNRFWIQPQYQDGELASFVFYGGGWGHNVGMDQVAVASMADSGHDYRKILRHFYTAIEFKNINQTK